ncbi:hypothetical protein [uncultured Sphingomonas sp.]|uniref:hypothetical protein n=1 Tax=uncultured Sphingomonas sp. TaxID=158754 RepID=UPI0035CB026B
MTDTPAERAEAARTRRRWVSLAEVVAVVGVLIGALSLYTTWSDHRADDRTRTQAEAAATQEKGRFELRGLVSHDGGSIALLRDERHELRDVRVSFPTTLAIGAKDAVDQTIDRDWFERPLLDATPAKSGDQVGRLPIFITYTYGDGNAQRAKTGIYDIVWRTRGRFLRGRALTITGFRSRAAGGSQAALDALWAGLQIAFRRH